MVFTDIYSTKKIECIYIVCTIYSYFKLSEAQNSKLNIRNQKNLEDVDRNMFLFLNKIQYADF